VGPKTKGEARVWSSRKKVAIPEKPYGKGIGFLEEHSSWLE